MKIFLTGATGLLGSHCLELGLNAGHTFIIPHRKISKRSYLHSIQEESKIKLIECDLTNELPLSLIKDSQVIINCAALASPFQDDYEKMKSINVNATKNLYHLGKLTKVDKFIQISSSAVLGSHNQDDLLSEESRTCIRETPYSKTKSEIDKWLREQDELPLVTIYPGYMLGKYDSRPSSGAILFALKMKKILHYYNGVKNFVAASDVAKGIYSCLEKEKTGHYILGGENKRISYVMKKFSDSVGFDFSLLQEVDRHQIQDKVLAREFCLTQGLSSDKAIKELDYKTLLSFEEQLIELLIYFNDKNILRSKK